MNALLFAAITAVLVGELCECAPLLGVDELTQISRANNQQELPEEASFFEGVEPLDFAYSTAFSDDLLHPYMAHVVSAGLGGSFSYSYSYSYSYSSDMYSGQESASVGYSYSSVPTAAPTTDDYSASPTASPTVSEPTASPTVSEPTASPTVSEPTASPTVSEPTASPTLSPTSHPTAVGETNTPTKSPTTSPTAAPSATPGPLLTSALFGSNGDKVYIFFDKPGDKAFSKLSKFGSIFSCADLFVYDGASSDTCVWTSASLVTVTVVYSADGPNLAVGEDVTLRAGMLRAACAGAQCNTLPYSASHATPVLAPTAPAVPVASLSVAPGSRVAMCSSFYLNPTQSMGAGGRPWSQILWSVSGPRNSDILTLLSSYEVLGTNSILLVPNSYLDPGVYTFSLTVSNFLGVTSATTSVSVTVESAEVVPTVSISGPGIISTFRDRPLNLYATGGISVCGVELSDKSLVFSWSVFQNSVLMTGITSSSVNPRKFSLLKDTLLAGTSYVVMVTVSTKGGLSSNYEVTVNVGRRGVKAVLPEDFTVFEEAQLSIDGTNSRDLDFPAASLNYAWSCEEISPVQGSSCGSLTLEGGVLSFPANTFATGTLRSLAFSLVVSSGSFSDESVVIVTFATRPVPDIYIGARATKYDPHGAIQIACFVSSPYLVEAVWDSSDVALSSVASTNLKRVFNNGKQSFFLGIKADSLTPGAEYTMSVSVEFVNGDASAIGAHKSIVLVMNEPPSGGVFLVSPLSGDTLVTDFSLVTASWTDDVEDLPLTFEFSYYTASFASRTTLREKTSANEAVVFLPVGHFESDYRGNCVVFVRDIYGTPGSVTVGVTVNPLSGEQLTSAVENALEEAVLEYDSATVTSVIASVMALLDNDILNIVPVEFCSLLNRDPQSTTPETCGDCKTGFIGIEGHSNEPCVEVVTQRRLEVTYANKTCPGNCSDHGSCVLFDYNRIQTDSCRLSDPYCRAECVCYEGFAGQYCGVIESELETQRNLRSTLCESVNATLTTRDIDASAVVSIANSIAQIFQDISLVDDTTIDMCSKVIFDLVSAHQDETADESSLRAILNVLSMVLESSYAKEYLLDELFAAVMALAEYRQNLMTMASNPFFVLKPNIRFMVTLAYTSDYASGLYRPRFFAEGFDDLADDFVIFRNTPNGTSAVVSGTDVLGAYLIEFLTDVRGFTDGTNLIIGTADYNVVEEGLRRLDNGLGSLNGLTYLARLEHNRPLAFPYTPAEAVDTYCVFADSPYAANLYCTHLNRSYEVLCPGDQEGYFNFVCPSISTSPVCTYWDGLEYSADTSCAAVSFDETYTLCECNFTAREGRRLELNQLGATVIEQSMELLTVWANESVSFVGIPLGAGDHAYDYQAVLIGVSVGTCCCVTLLVALCLRKGKSDSTAGKRNTVQIKPEVPNMVSPSAAGRDVESQSDTDLVPVVGFRSPGGVTSPSVAPAPFTKKESSPKINHGTADEAVLSIRQAEAVDNIQKAVLNERISHRSFEPSAASAVVEPLVVHEPSTDKTRNRSFLLFKPHADTVEVRSKVHSMLSQKGIDIVGAGAIPLSQTDGAADIVDAHYKDIAQNATELSLAHAQLTDAQKTVFLSMYGESWDAVVARGAVLNAVECCTHLKISASELLDAWDRGVKENKLCSLRENMECCLIHSSPDLSPVYCINGFYLSLRDSYLSAASPVHYFLLEFDESVVSWSQFSEDIIGSSLPSGAAKYSVRGQLLRKRDELNVGDCAPSVLHNFIHVSLSSFQCLADKVNWLKISVDKDPLGMYLLSAGITEEAVSYLASNPIIAGATVFSHVEELEFGACFQTLQVLARQI